MLCYLTGVIGFFQYIPEDLSVSRDVLRDIAGQFQNRVENRSQRCGAPILEAPEDRRDKFLDAYFRKAKPPLLAVWGKNDPFFIPAGAEAFRKDIPDAQVQFLDTGHFAIETHVSEIAAAMREFLEANDISPHTNSRVPP